MHEKLIAGYTAYTTADEYGTAAAGNAPATWVTVTIFVVGGGAALGAGSLATHC